MFPSLSNTAPQFCFFRNYPLQSIMFFCLSMVGVGRAVKRTVFGDSLTVYLKELHVPVEYVPTISMF